MKNVVEGIVAQEYERIRPSVAGFCGCGACRDDVLVYALNRLRPHYVAQRSGEVITSVTMSKDQSMADVTVALVEAFRRVQAEPRGGVAHGAT